MGVARCAERRRKVSKLFCQCSCCGKSFYTIAFPGVPEVMFFNEGYRANGDALYCPECVKTWQERNGAEFDEQYKDPPHLFAMWWNQLVERQTEDKSKIKKYKTAANGDCVEADHAE